MSDKNPIDMLKDLLGNDETAEQVNELVNTFKGNKNTGSNSSNINPQMLNRMRKMMDVMESSKNDSRTSLLHSLKPYLNSKRQGKIDQCVEFLGMSQMLKIMKEQKNKEE